MAVPAARVSFEHPLPLAHDFEYLDHKAMHAKVVFRIHSETESASPLKWTGDKDTSGFCCINGNFEGMLPEAYRAAQGHKRGNITWAEGPYMSQSVVDHILGRHRQTALNLSGLTEVDNGGGVGGYSIHGSRASGQGEMAMRGEEGVPEDEKSPWISTSKNLTWCIWEIARRLSNTNPSNHLDVVYRNTTKEHRANLDDVDHQTRLYLVLIKHHSGTVGLNDPRRTYLEAHIDAASPIGNTLRRTKGGGSISMSVRDAYQSALREAQRSKEILYYGRISGHSIDSDTTWTTRETGLALPPYFFKPPNQAYTYEHDGWIAPYDEPYCADEDPTTAAGWLTRLVWDPRYDDYDTACQKLNMSKRRGWQ